MGCGGPSLVPVSGTVTVNGKPVPNAVVTFHPLAPVSGIDPGPDSEAVTDAHGIFVLKAKTGQVGAMPGRHLVEVTATGSAKAAANVRSDRGKVSSGPSEFDVPPGGTMEANFELNSH
jgi:hypothetical protein